MPNAPSGTAPKFTAKPTIRQTGSGGVIFEVRLSANPAPVITWFKGTTAVSDGGRYRVTAQTDGMNYVLMLEIGDVTAQDGGSYKVNAKNALGESNANINLNLEGMNSVSGRFMRLFCFCLSVRLLKRFHRSLPRP